MSNAIKDDNQPATVVVSQLVKPGCEQAYEQWMRGIANEAIKFEGHLGINKIRPQKGSRPEYVTIFKFNCYANLKKWMVSDVRAQWLAKSNQLVQNSPDVQLLNGMEYLVYFTR